MLAIPGIEPGSSADNDSARRPRADRRRTAGRGDRRRRGRARSGGLFPRARPRGSADARMLSLGARSSRVVAFHVGLLELRRRRARAEPKRRRAAEAIVALTGGSLERLTTGVRLLEAAQGRAAVDLRRQSPCHRRRNFTRRSIVDPALGACCVDIGRTAEDTLGNAVGNRGMGARAQLSPASFSSPTIITCRARTAELSLAMPEAEIHPYPVRTRWTDPALWRSDLGAASRLGRGVREVSRHSRARSVDRPRPPTTTTGRRHRMKLAAFGYLRHLALRLDGGDRFGAVPFVVFDDRHVWTALRVVGARDLVGLALDRRRARLVRRAWSTCRKGGALIAMKHRVDARHDRAGAVPAATGVCLQSELGDDAGHGRVSQAQSDRRRSRRLRQSAEEHDARRARSGRAKAAKC